MNKTWLRWVVLLAALLLLDAAVTFHNIWPTPAVGWRGELSLELAVCILALALAFTRWGVPSRGLRRGFALLWVAMAIGRYIAVTAPALWGRELNFYWDLRFLPDVASMLARAAPLWLVVVVLVVSLGALFSVYLLFRRAFDVVSDAIQHRTIRLVLIAAATVAIGLFVQQRLSGGRTMRPQFAVPVAQTYARQARFFAQAIRGLQSLGASPSFDADLARVKGADVLLFFLELYGAVVFERPDFVARLDGGRRDLEDAIHASGHEVVSAYVESPTFGGSSWFAHITLLSGLEVGDPDRNALLMTESRDTLPKAFARHGYRSVAMMPGLWYPWPEGSFYGFADVFTGETLNYRGPSFGWWSLSDQFTLAKLDDLEMSRPSRAPLFVFFPTVSTHTPFAPTPPYQPDWRRMLTDKPYDLEAVLSAYDVQPDWMNLSPSYASAVDYAYQTLAGYLRQHAGQDFVMILIGDHQPPALVSGEGVPWDVPVHVITNRLDVLESLTARGFRKGLTPARPSLGKMHTLTPMLLEAFSNKN